VQADRRLRRRGHPSVATKPTLGAHPYPKPTWSQTGRPSSCGLGDDVLLDLDAAVDAEPALRAPIRTLPLPTHQVMATIVTLGCPAVLIAEDSPVSPARPSPEFVVQHDRPHFSRILMCAGRPQMRDFRSAVDA
jgi:hypothetical protein